MLKTEEIDNLNAALIELRGLVQSYCSTAAKAWADIRALLIDVQLPPEVKSKAIESKFDQKNEMKKDGITHNISTHDLIDLNIKTLSTLIEGFNKLKATVELQKQSGHQDSDKHFISVRETEDLIKKIAELIPMTRAALSLALVSAMFQFDLSLKWHARKKYSFQSIFCCSKFSMNNNHDDQKITSAIDTQEKAKQALTTLYDDVRRKGDDIEKMAKALCEDTNDQAAVAENRLALR